MKITKEHKKVFEQALELWNEDVMNFLCVLIDSVRAPHELKHECKEIINHYFNPSPTLNVIWLGHRDGLTFNESQNCRMIALYSLIYMP